MYLVALTTWYFKSTTDVGLQVVKIARRGYDIDGLASSSTLWDWPRPWSDVTTARQIPAGSKNEGVLAKGWPLVVAWRPEWPLPSSSGLCACSFTCPALGLASLGALPFHRRTQVPC